jgi:hypothetical protein
MNQPIDSPQDAVTQEQILGHLLHVSPKDVTLKFVFDHIRNYGICGVMLLAGARVVREAIQSDNPIDYVTGLVAWGVLFALPWLLFALNFAHGIFAVAALQDLSKVRKWVYFVLSFLVFVAAGRFMISALTGL